ncbi:MAG: M48 family metallopeptidase, partial [Clostridia bacterium]|nr:M48 family metallopeptidase [Clostridia bacterium]
YVIVHELIHTICFNHSPAFWKLVAEYEPDYKNLRKALKNYDFLIGLY